LQRSPAELSVLGSSFKIFHFASVAIRDPFGETRKFGKVGNRCNTAQVEAGAGGSGFEETGEVATIHAPIIS
jgi:hypothetical protein